MEYYAYHTNWLKWTEYSRSYAEELKGFCIDKNSWANYHSDNYGSEDKNMDAAGR